MESIAKILFAIHKTQILTYYVQQENRQPSKWLHKYEEFEAETSNNMIWPTPYFHIFYASETKVRDALKKKSQKSNKMDDNSCLSKWIKPNHVYNCNIHMNMYLTIRYQVNTLRTYIHAYIVVVVAVFHLLNCPFVHGGISLFYFQFFLWKPFAICSTGAA